jgi:amidophosphoribosyltransferase
MVRNAGAKDVHVRISCPPTVSPCFYGVDTPTKRELIAANQSIEEIRQFIGCDTLAYLSLENLHKAVSDSDSKYCYACYTGKYPTELVNIDELMASRPNR